MTASMTRNRLCDVVSSKRGHASVLLTLMLVRPQGLGLNALHLCSYKYICTYTVHVHMYVYMYRTATSTDFDAMLH